VPKKKSRKLKPLERLEVASAKIERILGTLRTLHQLRANNDAILRSDVLSKQVGRSYAANAFNVFQGALFEAEIVRVCALWDATATAEHAVDRDSLPAVAWLLSHPDTIDHIVEQRRAERNSRPVRVLELAGGDLTEEEQEEIARHQRARDADAEAEKVRSTYEATRRLVAEVRASYAYLALKSYRDKHVAHTLVQTYDERLGKVVMAPEYGHETVLFEKAVEAFDGFYYVLRDASFSWHTSHQNTARCAAALWSRCELNVVE
jgi:hypothetical protein